MRVLISGASIAGLTTAYWLARAGHEVTVVERAPGVRTGGNGVDVRGAAAEVIQRMGLTASVAAHATDVRGMKFVDARDRTVARMPFAAGEGVEIPRGDLVRLLHEATTCVAYRFGESIVDVSEDLNGVKVTLSRSPATDGRASEAERFDLVVGADGMHSNTRGLAFGDSAEHVRHRGHYFAFADADPGLAEDAWVTMYNTPGRMAGVWRSARHHGAKAYFIFRAQDEIAVGHRDVEAQKALIRNAFTGVGWKVDRLLAMALADPEFYFDALAQVDMDTWSRGHVVLVGDAAWCASPASGAGAELALVGAYRLAGELAVPGRGLGEALRAYEEGMRPLVRRKQEIGMNVRLMVPRSGFGRRVRNGVVKSGVLRAAAVLERCGTAHAIPAYTGVNGDRR
ncbi:FAD-dependent oxidoreductase [Actinorhabdospora filicis]|uniref:FAD-dependent oxidoreductase n=1 Tax=Actinorhabdospora filicis TaxID=1785913 RepID=A0A9W6SQC6_9ACTN|nr:FAD-dependent monooxygenase [Actinorhabdospora filicis]GLZ80418.1 FAD-dependent oxidoreductase [Actinorhabdospora filicis]